VKPSYFQTPRTMRDATWSYNSDPIERFERSPTLGVSDWILAVVIAVGLAWLLVYQLSK